MQETEAEFFCPDEVEEEMSSGRDHGEDPDGLSWPGGRLQLFLCRC